MPTPNDNKNPTTTTTIATKHVYIVTTVAIKQYGEIFLNFASVLFNLAVKAQNNKFGNCFEYFWLDLFFAC